MITIKPRILIVEDDSFMLSLLSMLFESTGYTVQAVNKHSEAIPAAEQFQPDVILLDIHLDDGYTGYKIADDLKTHNTLSQTPTMFLTGEKDDELRCKAFMCGGLDFMRKPFDRHELLSRVKPLAMIGRMQKTLTKLSQE